MTSAWAMRTAQIDDEGTPVLLTFAGHVFEPLPSGALWWAAEQALLVADLHLEKLSSYARRGSLLPPYDTGLTLRRLEVDIERTGAAEVIALGDSFHRDEGTTTLLDADRLQLASLMGRARWTWISGNHDPAPHALGGACVPGLERAGLTLTHEPKRVDALPSPLRGRAGGGGPSRATAPPPPSIPPLKGEGGGGLIAGHLHPAAHIAMNGRSVRRPCFVHDGRVMVLPAYGAATGTLNILSPAFVGLLHWPTLEVAMIGRGRVYPVSPKRLVRGYDAW
ncbi:MAG: ligase-associated DNA damage response endonuclease PdeM [Devosia sp.]|uniref:metallophosphoesterase n=1 Tax=Devosia sp. TaxID=1871048 RepID=UPI001AD1B748|nr:ligase-associated DNA damage response endonuclease PdeM [Devosia sp.]MBN9316802.1 ligase-associated DNA damage response endonuclease PdeM [Devosia sp.]